MIDIDATLKTLDAEIADLLQKRESCTAEGKRLSLALTTAQARRDDLVVTKKVIDSENKRAMEIAVVNVEAKMQDDPR